MSTCSASCIVYSGSLSGEDILLKLIISKNTSKFQLKLPAWTQVKLCQWTKGSTDSHRLMMVGLMIFWLLMVQKWHAFSRNSISNFEFWSFPGFLICGRYSLVVLGSSSGPQLPLSHVITGISNQYSTVHCVTGIFFMLCFEFLRPIMPTNPNLCRLLLVRKRTGRQLTLR